jgi:hypothetical protein
MKHIVFIFHIWHTKNACNYEAHLHHTEQKFKYTIRCFSDSYGKCT